MPTPHSGRRTWLGGWWPLVLLLAVASVLVALNWLVGDRERQQLVLSTFGILAVSGLLALLWLVLLSPLSMRGRLVVLTASVLGLTASASLVRVRGVTGDFVPVLEWRWARSAPPDLPGPPPPEPHSAQHEPEPGTASAGEVEVPVEDDAGSPPPPAAVTPAVGAGEPAAAAAAPQTPRVMAASFPQFLGPTRDGVIAGAGLATDWTRAPPRLVWRQPVGAAWSGFVIYDGLAITQEQRGDDEAVVAYDFASGAVRWAHAYPARYATVVAGVGPRATPAAAGARVVTHGATGLLTVLDVRTGRRVWQRSLPAEHGAPEPEWGRSSSPLVLDGRVIVNAGGPGGHSLVAYELDSGELAWSGGSDRVGYASPVHVTLAGVPQVIAFNLSSVAAHDPATGALLWEHPWPGRQPNVSQPLPVGGDRLLVSSGYGVGSTLLRLSRDTTGTLQPEVVWESPRMKAKFTNLVLHHGFVYGLDDGVLVCLDLASGERRWKSGRYGHGQVLLVDDLLLVQTEDGHIVLVRPQPDRHVEVTRFQALDAKTWNPPALAGRHLLVRNDQEAALYELP